MKRVFGSFLLAVLSFMPVSVHAAYSDTGLLANAKEIFRPLLADPREIQLALRLVTPVGGQNLGEIAAGDYFGLYRWALPWQDSYMQWSIAGGVFSRFDLVAREKDNLATDYSANMPIDIRVGKWSARLLPYHQSSHLGDDYIKRHGVVPEKYTFDSYKTLLAYEPNSHWRLYGGYNYVMRNASVVFGRSMLQGGLEWASPWCANGHSQFFWASDFQSWERIDWNPIFNTQLGFRIAKNPEARQRLAIFSEYGTGGMSFGQFYRQKESHWVLGFRFEHL